LVLQPPPQEDKYDIMNRQHGFTLIELMITLGIAAILLTAAVPSFNTTIKNNRLITQTNLLVSSISLARSEAVKHGRTATVCVNSAQPVVQCTAETNWELGWMVWVDLNTNNQPDPGEERRYVQAFPQSTTLTSAVSRLNFTSQGAAANDATSGATLDLCDDRTGETGRQIGISATGRTKTDSNFAGCA
jgi:type IV fimbrial biogenesis protein FimT